METRPYNLQSPEQIAKDYGGNKQKIAEAMQMGILDPTAGTMAGMFIDRMRSAAQMEAAPQQTVAQQVMAPQPQMPPQGPPQGGPPVPPGAGAIPPAPPAGLGATPEAAAMPPMGGMPPMGAPPPPQGGPGMAMGGMVPPYASGGGLSDIPLPDDMFDESRNGGYDDGYAGGGMVAFADAGPVKARGLRSLVEKTEEELAAEAEQERINAEVAAKGILVNAPQKIAPAKSLGGATAFDMPASIAGMSGDLMTNLTNYQDMYTPERKQQDRLTAAYEEELTPESIKKAKKQDMWMALGQIGAKMATTPGSILQAASAGIGEALPGIAASAKERKADQRQMLKNLQEQEGLTNKEAKEAANIALDMQVKYGSLYQALQDNSFKERWAQMDDATRRYVAKLTAESSALSARLGLQGTLGAAQYGYNRELMQQQGLARKYVMDNIGTGGAFQIDYTDAPDKTKFINDKVNEVLGISPTPSANQYGAPPKDAVKRVN
jgi:hypothetical protein